MSREGIGQLTRENVKQLSALIEVGMELQVTVSTVTGNTKLEVVTAKVIGKYQDVFLVEYPSKGGKLKASFAYKDMILNADNKETPIVALPRVN